MTSGLIVFLGLSIVIVILLYEPLRTLFRRWTRKP